MNLQHLKNYQQSKLQQPNPILAPRASATGGSRTSLQSLDSQSNIVTKDQPLSQSSSTYEAANDKAPTSSRLAGGNLVDISKKNDINLSNENIPTQSARQQTKTPQQVQLLKSKSVDLSINQQQQKKQQDEWQLLSSSMSVDRLIARAESMGESDLRKSFKELVMENERLKSQLKGFDDSEKQKQQEWMRKERQLQRKISELEEENKQIEHWKQEIQRLKEENNSLIRVVSKLTKQ